MNTCSKYSLDKKGYLYLLLPIDRPTSKYV